ncbi:hypothetical protein TcWFU_005714 [Taenia crassiceps]|uniref:Uncharacterized protein n=1 Tax=Taenia crassiceps TaxID=6207 RepID=A0ABR4QEC7_9CEST
MVPTSRKAVVCNSTQNSYLEIDKTFCTNYIDPHSLETSPPNSDPLALLIETCDRVRRDLERTKFSTILCDLVCDIAAPSSLAGQKRPPSALLCHPPMKLRRSSCHLPLPTAPPLHTFILPPPQTEPVNLSSKLAEEATTFAPSPTIPQSLSPAPDSRSSASWPASPSTETGSSVPPPPANSIHFTPSSHHLRRPKLPFCRKREHTLGLFDHSTLQAYSAQHQRLQFLLYVSISGTLGYLLVAVLT